MLGFIIRRSCTNAVKDYIAGPKFAAACDDAIDKAIKANPIIQFILAMKWEALRVDPAMSPKSAYLAGEAALKDFLHDEKIKFGDPRYDWSANAAVDLMRAYEIDHWESHP